VEALLATNSVRIDVAGFPAIDGLSLVTTGDRLLVLGAAPALFQAAAGVLPIQRGEIRVANRVPADALRTRAAAGAALDPLMPPSWTVRQYVTWSARLAGHSRATSRALAADALARLQLGPSAGAQLRRVDGIVRRATVVAAALATAAPTLLVEDPVAGMPAEVARRFATILVGALGDRRTALFAARLPLESPLALSADEAVVIVGSHVAAQGAPAEIAAGDRALLLRVGGDAKAFAEAVRAEGGRLLGDAGAGATVRVTVDLGTLRARDLLRLAAASNAVVLELRPLARGFA
jgi:ABC-type taurine transport system ATPase subunit